MSRGNGNNMHYVRVYIETCTGEGNVLMFDGPSFRECRELANRTMSTLAMVGSGGHDMSHYRGINDTYGWFVHFPNRAHLSRLTVSKVNRESSAARPFSVLEYPCEHNMVGR